MKWGAQVVDQMEVADWNTTRLGKKLLALTVGEEHSGIVKHGSGQGGGGALVEALEA